MLHLIGRFFYWLFIGPAPKAAEPAPVSSGSGYVSPPVVTITGSGGSGSTATVATNGFHAPEPDPEPSDDGAPFTLEPANGWIIVERMEMESVSRGGIVIPDQAKELNVKVIVLATCRNWVDEHGITRKSSYRVGDFLVISRYAGQQLVIDHGRIKVTTLRECDVIARIRVNRNVDRTPDAVSLPPEKRDARLEYEADRSRTEEYALDRNG